MRVLHVVESLERGGLERMVVDLCVGQKSAGFEVSVLCLFTRGVLSDELEAGGINVSTIAKGRGLDTAHLCRVRCHLQRYRPEVIHSHNATAAYLTAFSAVGLRDASNAKWVNTRHGMGSRSPRARKELLYRAVAGRYHHIAVVCRAAAERFSELGAVVRSRLRVVPNGIRLEVFRRADVQVRDHFRAAYGIKPRAFVIGTVGRLNELKNQVLLLDCMPNVLARVPSAHLVIVGGGALKDELTWRARELGLGEFVTLAGDSQDVPSWLQSFDVFALPSKTEGYSLALLEASASGLPVVCTDVGGNSEIVNDRETGLIVPSGDRDEMTSAIIAIAEDPNLRQLLGTNARLWADGNAGISAMVTAYDHLYRRS
jgi:glycosyltransferase involved in cell wall biosynthesis